MKPGFFDLEEPESIKEGDEVPLFGIRAIVTNVELVAEGFRRLTVTHPKTGDMRVTLTPEGRITMPRS